jgi:hypothetical protein
VNLDVVPRLDDDAQCALALALEDVGISAPGDDHYRQAWRLAALQEAAFGAEAEVGYAFSPRSTRGATRA